MSDIWIVSQDVFSSLGQWSLGTTPPGAARHPHCVLQRGGGLELLGATFKSSGDSGLQAEP